MVQEIIINGFSILGDINIEDRDNLKYVHFKTTITGHKEYNNYNNAITHSKLNIEIPSEDIKFQGETNGHSSSYTESLDIESIVYSISLNIKEINKEEPQNDFTTTIANIARNTILNWARTRALSEILIEKGLFTNEEYVDKINYILERDKEEFNKSITFNTNYSDNNSNQD